MSLQDYVDAEDRALKQSLLQYPDHYRLFGELADLYDALIHDRILTENDLIIPFTLFFIVQNQMLGVGSQLLRRRISDAECLTRRAVEVTAGAHYLWKHPEMNHVATSALFEEETPPWPGMRTLYERLSAMPAPAGSGIPVNYHLVHGALKLEFIEPDDRTVRQAWHAQFNVYGDLLEVFLTLFAASLDDAKAALFRVALSRWRERVADLLREEPHTSTNPTTTGETDGTAR